MSESRRLILGRKMSLEMLEEARLMFWNWDSSGHSDEVLVLVMSGREVVVFSTVSYGYVFCWLVSVFVLDWEVLSLGTSFLVLLVVGWLGASCEC